MKKTIPVMFIAALLSSQAMADPIYIDVSAATTQAPGNAGTATDANTFTSVFEQMQLFAQTTTIQYDTTLGGGPLAGVGDRFIDSGTAMVTDLLPPLGDDEGISVISELSVAWVDLTGFTTSPLTPIGVAGDVVQTIAYDPGAVLNFYFHGDATAGNADFGPHVGVADNVGFEDGEKVLEITVTGGSGTNTFDAGGNFLSGSSILNGEITFALDEFWWFDGGDGIPGTAGDSNFTDLLGLAIPVLLKAEIDQNTDAVETDFSVAGNPGPAGFGDALFAVHSSHDGSIDISIPGPQTLLLFMMGMMMMVAVRRQYKR